MTTNSEPNVSIENPEPLDTHIEKVWDVLNRNTAINSLSELRDGLNEARHRPAINPDTPIIFGFDTNAIFRLGQNGTKGANAVDFLRGLTPGSVVVPGQVIQELWNNALSGLEPKAKKLRGLVEDLETEMHDIDQHFGAPGTAVQVSIEALADAHSHWIDPASQETFNGVLDVLISVSSVSYVPRDRFSSLAQIRHNTKAPPGFRDKAGNHGDFFVWADFLLGLARVDRSRFGAVVFVTNDNKSDWSRNGVVHPLLIAEARAMTGLDFRLWTLPEFQRYANNLMN